MRSTGPVWMAAREVRRCAIELRNENLRCAHGVAYFAVRLLCGSVGTVVLLWWVRGWLWVLALRGAMQQRLDA